MNFLFYSTDYKPNTGGISEHTDQIARELYAKGHTVTLIAPSMVGDEDIDTNRPFTIYRMPNYPLILHLSLLLFPLWLSRKQKIDYIYCPTWFPTGLYSIMISKITVAESIIAVHGREVVYSDENLRKKLIQRLNSVQSLILRSASIVVTVSSYTKNKLVEIGVPAEKIHIIYNGVKPSDFETDEIHPVIEREGLSSDNILLTVSRLESRKGHDTVIRALPNILKDQPDTTYLIAGTGSEKESLRELAKEIGVYDHIFFLGYVPQEDLPKLYNSSDVFVMPARRDGDSVEGFGIVFLEANAAEKPVIGGRHGGITDAIQNGESGLLVEPEDEDELAGNVVELLSNKRKAISMGKAGLERCKNKFTWGHVADRLVGAIHETNQ
ncbi:glycosyltransferase family 4 protein [Halorubrum sp. DM2]|uniref:glycosyltransferase family 4 protein n=1 Tax=Halorubrum sp. DM2 TaxID=2527867 RepID=UPI0024B7FF48|nr:glycosyltransferase family 4 protein [Halorubrum sp. DM2]